MNVTRIIAFVFLAGLMLFIHYFVITQLLKTKADLIGVTGKVTNCYQVFKHGRSGYRAMVVVLDDSEILFAVDDGKQRAFNYLSNNDVIGKPAKIFYDPKGYFYPNKMTFYLDEVNVAGNMLMTMDEARYSFKFGGRMLVLLDVFFVGLFIRAKKLNKPFFK